MKEEIDRNYTDEIKYKYGASDFAKLIAKAKYSTLLVEYRYGYRNKITKQWLCCATGKYDEVEVQEFSSNVLFIARDYLIGEFDWRCRRGVLKSDEWELVKIKMTYEEEITNE